MKSHVGQPPRALIVHCAAYNVHKRHKTDKIYLTLPNVASSAGYSMYYQYQYLYKTVLLLLCILGWMRFGEKKHALPLFKKRKEDLKEEEIQIST